MKHVLFNLLYGILFVLSLLPMRLHYVFSDFIYVIVYHLVGYRKKLVRKHLSDSFPDKSEEEIVRIEKAFYCWLCDYLVETLKLLSISEKELKRRMNDANEKPVDASSTALELAFSPAFS